MTTSEREHSTHINHTTVEKSEANCNSLSQEARAMTYNTANIRSSFEATGIEPLNPRRVLPILGTHIKETCSIHIGFSISATVTHGRSILMHGRRTMNLLPDGTPLSKLKRGMVEKLVTASAASIADNVILVTENTRLRKRAMTAEEKQKSKSRRHLSKARVISAKDVVRLQLTATVKQQLLAEKQVRMLEKKKAKELKKVKEAKELARRGRPKHIRVVAGGEEPKEVQSVEDEMEGSESSESSASSEMAYQAPNLTVLAVLATPASSKTRAGRAHAAAIGVGGGSS